ncbi:STAS domain-containing protein [Streptomyces sp. NPDC004111]|uniref:STAS domain-containing protein n=1 Tax=Streptomyces sp. NPDC004111 TaxID=3364690 RepID=UPI00367A0F29
MPDSRSRPSPLAGQYTRDGWHVIVARGELDLDSLPPLRTALETAAATGSPIVVDLGAVTYVDSMALNLFLQIHHATTLRLAAPGPQVCRLFDITGADQVLDLRPTLTDAPPTAA